MIQPVIRRVPPIGVKGPMMDFIQCCSFNIDFAMASVYNEPQNKMMPISNNKRLMFFSFIICCFCRMMSSIIPMELVN